MNAGKWFFVYTCFNGYDKANEEIKIPLDAFTEGEAIAESKRKWIAIFIASNAKWREQKKIMTRPPHTAFNGATPNPRTIYEIPIEEITEMYQDLVAQLLKISVEAADVLRNIAEVKPTEGDLKVVNQKIYAADHKIHDLLIDLEGVVNIDQDLVNQFRKMAIKIANALWAIATGKPTAENPKVIAGAVDEMAGKIVEWLG